MREKIRLAAMQQVTEANLEGLVFTLAFDRTVRNRFVEQIQEIVKRAGETVHFVEFTCIREELESRLVQPSRAEFGKLGSGQDLRSLLQNRAFDGPLLPLDRLVVETIVRSAQEVADLIRTFARRTGCCKLET